MNRFSAQIAATEITPVGEGAVRLGVRVRNTSDRPWPADGPVFLAYQVLDENAEALIAEGERVGFGKEVAPGEEALATLTIELPPEQATYRVLVSPVEEPVAWFFERGSDCLVVRAEVNGGGAVRAEPRRETHADRRWERVRRRLKRLFVQPFTTIARHRGLIASMVRRDIHGRYRGSMAGLFWAVIHPLLLMVTYFFVFAVVLNVRFGPGPAEAGPMNFLLYFICGMVPWLAFSEALGRAPSVVLEHRTLVTRVVFPVEILPVNLAVSGLVTQFFATAVFVAALAALGRGLPLTAAWLPTVLAPQLLLTVGCCWALAALGVFLRDTGQFMAFALTMLFFATPICYPESALPQQARWLFEANPVYALVRAYRAMFLEGAAPDARQLAALWGGGAAVFFAGFGFFYKSRKSFADVL